MVDYEQTYEDFWKAIVENPDGNLNLDKLKRELHDFKTLVRNVSLVYDHVTGGRISKPMTDPGVVIAEADDCYRKLCDDEMKEA